MSQSSLKILILGVDVKITDSATAQLRAQGIDADSLAISNTPESDAAIARIVDSKNWNGLIVGHGVRQNHEWFERVMRIINNTKPNIALIQTKDRNDVENAIEHHFNIKLPLTKA
jgi:UDP-N-acetyl-D-mannosaminuronic acid transferase (WecB/TagA/CpsF family)